MLRKLLDIAGRTPSEQERFERDLREILAAPELAPCYLYRHGPRDPLPGALVAAVRRLAARWPGGKAGSLAAAMYFAPLDWQPRYPRGEATRWAMLDLLLACLVTEPPPDVARRLEARMQAILLNPYVPDEASERSHDPGTWMSPGAWNRGEFVYLQPCLEQCLWLLVATPPSPEILDLGEKLIRGGLDASPVGLGPRSSLVQSAYEASEHELAQRWTSIEERLFEAGRLTYDVFRESAIHFPIQVAWLGIRTPDGQVPGFDAQAEAAFIAALRDYCGRLARELLEGLSEGNWQVGQRLANLRGVEWLLAAARYHAGHRLGKLVYDGYTYRRGFDAAIVRFADALEVEPRDSAERASAIAELRRYPARTLKYLMPVASHGRRLLLEALGWERAWPLVQEVIRAAGLDPEAAERQEAIRNSPNPEVGVIDADAARAVLAQAGDDVAKEVLGLLKAARIHAENAVILFQAVAGWNREEVEAGRAKRVQNAVRAYGLLPIERGPDEVLERYLFLRGFERESKQFGAQRQATERAAAQAALANLAQVAGYGSAGRLEWAMEARLAEGTTAAGQTWQAGEYELALELDGVQADLVIRKAGKALKSAPPAVRKTAAYAEANDALSQIRDQVARFRAALEQQMVLRQPFELEDLRRAATVPAAKALLSRLVLIDEAGQTGLYDPTVDRLAAPGGDPLPVRGRLRVAHPYELFHGSPTAGSQLAAWQREIVRLRIVQPFKQVYRELYLLTPAEEATRVYTSRFAGQRLTAKVVYRLLQSRSWQFSQNETSRPQRVFPALRLQAFFEFPDVGHFFSENDLITSGRLFFARYPLSDWQWEWAEPDEIGIPLAEVPPQIFSEVLRDADLVVSIAQAIGDAQFSEEAYQRRAELVANLMETMGMDRVTIEGHHACVQGRLARYRVQLASGAIHIEPGGHLCIVPDLAALERGQVYLPFADEGNPKLSEIISKVLMLADDGSIRDPQILMQIMHGR